MGHRRAQSSASVAHRLVRRGEEWCRRPSLPNGRVFFLRTRLVRPQREFGRSVSGRNHSCPPLRLDTTADGNAATSSPPVFKSEI